jgi:uncharacterized protein YecT (DUF1311 family)
MNRLAPKPSTIRALFAKSGNECSFPGCEQSLVDDRNLFIGEVCHINAVKDLDARYDPTKNDEELRAYENLILLCHQHHVRIDSFPDEYSVKSLYMMRGNHEKKVEKKAYTVSDDIINDALFQFLQLEWNPQFEPIINYLIADIDKAHGGQQGMNQRLGQICELLDASLYILMLRILAASNLSERRRLLREHYEWRDCRHDKSHEHSLQMDSGSAQPFLYYGTYNRMTKERIALLESIFSGK